MDEALMRFRGELRRCAERRVQQRRRRRRAVLVLAALGVLALTGGSIAAIRLRDSLGSPAPASVVRDFGSYATPLGYHPRVGDAVLAARDEAADVDLYATPNAEGTSCVTITAPWKTGPAEDDGGTCIALADATAPILAGLLGGNTSRDGAPIFVMGGRVATPGAVAVRFTTVTGDEIERPLGIGGFFVVALTGRDTGILPGGCARDWAPALIALAANGRELTSAVIHFTHAVPGDACGGGRRHRARPQGHPPLIAAITSSRECAPSSVSSPARS